MSNGNMSLEEARAFLTEGELKQFAQRISKGGFFVPLTQTGEALVEVRGKKVPLFHLMTLVAPYETPYR